MKTRTSQDPTAPSCPPLDTSASVHLTIVVATDDGGDDNVAGDIRNYANRLPPPASLPPGAWVAIQLTPARHGLLSRALGRGRHRRLGLAACCTALLAAGYESVCADDSKRAFGRVPMR